MVRRACFSLWILALLLPAAGQVISPGAPARDGPHRIRVDQGRGLRPGTGLGLAIVKHIIARHRGEFLVESEVGRGSAFGVVIPQPRPEGMGGTEAASPATGESEPGDSAAAAGKSATN